jgi:hypothetical protein
VRSIPASVRTDLKLSYFYQRYTEAYGIPIIGSNKVSTSGLKRACYVLRFYLADRDQFKESFFKRNVRVVVMATTENVLNVPEYSSLPPSWNSLRGLSPTRNIPLVTIADENLQCSNDKYKYHAQMSPNRRTLKNICLKFSILFVNLKEPRI